MRDRVCGGLGSESDCRCVAWRVIRRLNAKTETRCPYEASRSSLLVPEVPPDQNDQKVQDRLDDALRNMDFDRKPDLEHCLSYPGSEGTDKTLC
ncbi:hypothetical protein [Mesorhizobium sp. M1E.F.Ca.ET.063.01.1.1]|uniref:hypothetical protein n=1 Tax=Mesorhizobium sp. M1E.F.Ca.ET.063.01.1.1 TaxID=2496750 RepID=UPI0016734A3E|nr:hypothetical protein [Mesorhizobium sp. M1E.F.Ca.ET.063.01.1.1]